MTVGWVGRIRYSKVQLARGAGPTCCGIIVGTRTGTAAAAAPAAPRPLHAPLQNVAGVAEVTTVYIAGHLAPSDPCLHTCTGWASRHTKPSPSLSQMKCTSRPAHAGGMLNSTLNQHVSHLEESKRQPQSTMSPSPERKNASSEPSMEKPERGQPMSLMGFTHKDAACPYTHLI